MTFDLSKLLEAATEAFNETEVSIHRIVLTRESGGIVVNVEWEEAML